jgi:hypothetical protein
LVVRTITLKDQRCELRTFQKGMFFAAKSPAKSAEGLLMKKTDLSDAASNLLIFGSVSLAIAPFLLGDRLVLVVSGLMKEGGVMLAQFTNYVSWLLS